MNQEIKRLLKNKRQWENDIRMYKDFLNNNLIAQQIFIVSHRYLEKLNRKCINTVSMREIKNIEKDMIQILETYLIDKKKDNGFLSVELKKFVRKHINLIKEILCFQIRIYRGYQTNNIPNIDINFDAVNLCQNQIVKTNKKFRKGDIRNGKYLNLPAGIINPSIETWRLSDEPCDLGSTLEKSEFKEGFPHKFNYKLDEFLNYFKNNFSTPEIKIKCSDDKKFSVIENLKLKVQDKYTTKYCNFIDGIRVDLDIGW